MYDWTIVKFKLGYYEESLKRIQKALEIINQALLRCGHKHKTQTLIDLWNNAYQFDKGE